MQSVDALIVAKWVVPVEPPDIVFADHGVAIDHGKIVGVAPVHELKSAYHPKETVILDHHVLTPGYVNAHCHSPMTLMRGVADDIPLDPWLKEYIWPMEQRWISPEFVRDGTMLALGEMLRGGTTCVQDMYFFPDVMAHTAAEVGMRAGVGAAIIDFPNAWAGGASECVEKALKLRDDYKGHPLIRVMLAPHSTYTVAPEVLSQLGVLADQLDMGIHIHLHETAQEVEDVIAMYGQRPLALLRELGLMTPALTGVHMTQITDEELTWLAESNCRVVHCPESNLKLASGFCPVTRLLEHDITVGLGTDGAASNNNLSMLGEMQTAALLAKGVASDPTAVSAHTALRMATLGSARTMGMDDEVGSLIPGKWADLTAVSLDSPDMQPVFDPVSQLVYAAGDQHVTDVWVGGRRQVERGQLIGLDSNELVRNAREWYGRFKGD